MSDMTSVTRENFLQPEVRWDFAVTEDRKRQWKVMLDLLEIFSGICDKYHLRWFLDFGSLLGAIRHGGFIPWDDDLDIAMPRKDYDKFQKIVAKELPERVFFQSSYTDNGHRFSFSRLRMKNTAFIDEWTVSVKSLTHMGIFIDIYPKDVYVSKGIRRNVILGIRKLICHCFDYDQIVYTPTFASKSAKVLGGLLRRCILLRVLLFRFRDFLLRNCAGDGRLSHLLVDKGFDDGVVQSSWFKTEKEVDFEYLKVKIPGGAEEVLTAEFGDWRKPVYNGASHSCIICYCDRDYKTVLREHPEFGYSEHDILMLP